MRALSRLNLAMTPFILIILGALLVWPLPPAGGQSPAPPQARPAIYEFSRKLCPVCHEMEETLMALKYRYPGQFEVRLLFIDQEEYLFRRYKISIVPCHVFLDASGKEVFLNDGLFPKEKLEKKLRDLNFIHD